jgi:hypothetical protein
MGSLKETDKLIYIYGKNTIELGAFSLFKVTDFSEKIDNNLTNTKAIGQDGVTCLSSSLDSRFITIKGLISMRNEYEELERKMRICFNPKQDSFNSGKLIYRGVGFEKEIEAIPLSMVYFDRKLGVSWFKIELQATNPYWGLKDQVEVLAELTPKLYFNMQFASPVIFANSKSMKIGEIVNKGDVPAGFRAKFKCRDGTVKNVQIENKITGDLIKINVDMVKGDVLEIISTPTYKNVLLNNIKSFSKLDRKISNFFYLDVGKNTLSYDADINYSNLDVSILYSPLFL